MPLTEKGEKIKRAMVEQYGKERGEQVFYASKNKGTITGVDAFRRGIRDAVRRGVSFSDAIGNGLAVRNTARQARGGDFFRQIRDGVADGLPAHQILDRALSYRKPTGKRAT